MCGKGCGLRPRSVALAEQGVCTTHIPFPLSDGVTLLQAAPQEEPMCETVGEGQSLQHMGLGMSQGATCRACGMRFTTRVKPCLLEWEEEQPRRQNVCDSA